MKVKSTSENCKLGFVETVNNIVEIHDLEYSEGIITWRMKYGTPFYDHHTNT